MVGGKTRLYGARDERSTGESGLIPENYLVLAEDLLEQLEADAPPDQVPASSSFAALERQMETGGPVDVPPIIQQLQHQKRQGTEVQDEEDEVETPPATATGSASANASAAVIGDTATAAASGT